MQLLPESASLPVSGNHQIDRKDVSGDAPGLLQRLAASFLDDLPISPQQVRSLSVLAVSLCRKLFRNSRGSRDGSWTASEVQVSSRVQGAIELVSRGIGTSRRPLSWTARNQARDLVCWLSRGKVLPRDGAASRKDVPRGRPSRAASRVEADHPLRPVLHRQVVEPTHALQLFNALPASDDLHWVVVPLRGWLDSLEPAPGQGGLEDHPSLDALLKVGWHRKKGRPVSAFLSATREDGRSWWFQWDLIPLPGGVSPRLVDLGGETDAIPQDLLARLGFSGHTGSVKKRYEGGGTAQKRGGEAEQSGIDTYG